MSLEHTSSKPRASCEMGRPVVLALVFLSIIATRSCFADVKGQSPLTFSPGTGEVFATAEVDEWMRAIRQNASSVDQVKALILLRRGYPSPSAVLPDMIAAFVDRRRDTLLRRLAMEAIEPMGDSAESAVPALIDILKR